MELYLNEFYRIFPRLNRKCLLLFEKSGILIVVSKISNFQLAKGYLELIFASFILVADNESSLKIQAHEMADSWPSKMSNVDWCR